MCAPMRERPMHEFTTSRTWATSITEIHYAPEGPNGALKLNQSVQ